VKERHPLYATAQTFPEHPANLSRPEESEPTMSVLSWISGAFAFALIGSQFLEIGAGGLASTIGLGLVGTIALGRVRDGSHRARHWASHRQRPMVGEMDRAKSRDSKFERRNRSLAADSVMTVANPLTRIANKANEDQCDARAA
jgi:hypothetical protein